MARLNGADAENYRFAALRFGLYLAREAVLPSRRPNSRALQGMVSWAIAETAANCSLRAGYSAR